MPKLIRWMNKRPNGGRLMTLNQWYVYRLRGHAAAMVIITLLAAAIGANHSPFASYGLLASVVTNAIIGTAILHLIDRARPLA
jgi:hypothetical protein